MVNENMVNANEKSELYSSIWAIAEKMRGSVDGWDFKAYVMGTMFYRYLSENLTDYINKKRNKPNYNYADIGENGEHADECDAEAEKNKFVIVRSKGFFIKPSQLFANVCARAEKDPEFKAELPGHVSNIMKDIIASTKGGPGEKQFDGLFDDVDFGSNKLGASAEKRVNNLFALLTNVRSMNLSVGKDTDIDAFGDAYEYLMAKYASQAGKFGGEFFTPTCVSELVAKLAANGRTEINKAYDPACGSGSLLLQARKLLGAQNVNGYFGQEINTTTYNLCRMNMFLHNISFNKFDIANDDTLLAPKQIEKGPFDMVTSNPPYGIHWDNSDPTLIQKPYFEGPGVLAPKSAADMAFILHIMHVLSEDGTAAIVEFPGILYRNGAEQKIRKYLVENNYVDAIIQLPANMFYGATIATCILVMKKNKKDNKITFVDASNEFVKVTKNNIMTKENIDKVYNAVMNREDSEHFVHVVSTDEVADNDYNLSVSTYVEPEDTKEKIDIDALNAKIKDVVLRNNELRAEIDEFIADYEG